MSDSDNDDNDDDDEEEKVPAIEEDAPPVSKLLESDEEEIPATPGPETKTRTGDNNGLQLVNTDQVT